MIDLLLLVAILVLVVGGVRLILSALLDGADE